MNDLIQNSDLKKTPHLPHDESGPVFAAPWEAKAFAITLNLHQQGLFDWAEWCDTLSEEIKAAQAAGDPDLGDTYYIHWLGALEKLITKKEFVSMEKLVEFKEDWGTADNRREFGEAPVLVRGAGETGHH